MGDSNKDVKPTLQWISKEYHDLNGTHYLTLEQPPTALEFSRLVHISRPVVIRGVEMPALQCWTDEYLIEEMGSQKISVAVTPDGRADAVTPGPDARLYFTEPFTEQMTMKDLLLSIGGESIGDANDRPGNIHYLQSQNGNLYSSPFFQGDPQDSSEFEALRKDVPSEVRWCSEALNRAPDAVNLWIGDSRSVTSIHSDPYENIYTVIRGIKHFTLLPPTEGWTLNEQLYPHAIYDRAPPSEPLSIKPSDPATTPSIRWSSIANPHLPGALPPDAHPIHISVSAGETLYLPAGWWHHVRQGSGSEDREKVIAINWWYDIEGQGMSWVWLNLFRSGGV